MQTNLIGRQAQIRDGQGRVGGEIVALTFSEKHSRFTLLIMDAQGNLSLYGHHDVIILPDLPPPAEVP